MRGVRVAALACDVERGCVRGSAIREQEGMEIVDKRAVGAFERSPMPAKLSQRYRVVKKAPDAEWKDLRGKLQQDIGLSRLPNFAFVKQEAVEWNGSGNGPRRGVEAEPARLFCRASNVLVAPSRGVQSGYQSFPNAQLRMQLSDASAVGTHLVSAVAPLAFSSDVELFSAASANLGSLPAAEARTCVDTSKELSQEMRAKPLLPSSVENCDEEIEGTSPPSMSVSVMTHDSVLEQAKEPFMVTANPIPSAQTIPVFVKLEAVEKTEEKLITAMDMFGGGALSCSSSSPFTEVAAHDLERNPLEAAPKKLMTASEMFVHEQVKNSPVESLQAPKIGHPRTALRSSLLHVKSEPVDNSPGVIGAGGSLKELPKLFLQYKDKENGNAPKVVAVKLESPIPSGVFTEHSEYQAAHISSDGGYATTGSEHTDQAKDKRVEANNGTDVDPEGILSVLTRKSQKGKDGGRKKVQKEIKHRNSNPGRRIQSGRIYDSSFGKTCHWCRQKTVEHHVKCRECAIHYCGPCLMNRNGENIREELVEGVRWLCPKCRNGCGPGCDNCCNCGPCRKADGKSPTGQLVWAARNAGFENAHDYLVHLETGETPQEIAQRKEGRDWTNCGMFKCTDTAETSESREDASSNGEANEFTLNEETSTQLHEGKLDMKVVKRFVESHKRKRGVIRVGAMRGSIPAKRNQQEISKSPECRRRDVDSILARLKVTGQKIPQGTKNQVEQQFKTKAEPIQCDLAVRNNQNSGTSTRISVCNREHVEVDPGNHVGRSDLGVSAVATKRRKLEGCSGEERRPVLNEIMTSRSTLFSPFTEVNCKIEPTTFSDENHGIAGSDKINGAGPRRNFIKELPGGQGSTPPVSESELILKMRGASVLKHELSSVSSSQMMFEQRGMECPSDPQGTEYRTKLKSALAHPFDAKELETLDESAKCRKPVQKLRQMRGRIVDVVTEDEGLSYLDHQQDFAMKLEKAASPPEKLALLRGFFFWLQHSCMEGAFKPWSGALAQLHHQSGDCMETEGPDCQVTAVLLQVEEGRGVLQLDEEKEAPQLDGAKEVPQLDEEKEAPRRVKRKYTKKNQRPIVIEEEDCKPEIAESNSYGSSISRQILIPFQVKKSSVQHVKPKARTQSSTVQQPTIRYRVVLCLPAPALRKI